MTKVEADAPLCANILSLLKEHIDLVRLVLSYKCPSVVSCVLVALSICCWWLGDLVSQVAAAAAGDLTSRLEVLKPSLSGK